MAAVRAGLIGCGAVALYGILPQITQPDVCERLELVAVCDVVEARAQQAAQRFGVAQAYGDAMHLIEHPDIELVIISTPIPFHYALAQQALAAGKHVYVQKTMASTYAEAQELVATAKRRGLTLVAAPGQMLAPAMQKMKALVHNGALGKIYWAIGTTTGAGHEYERNRQGDDALSNVDPTWYYKQGGGPLKDVTVYVLHSLTGILGPAKRVTAMSGIGLPERRWRNNVIPVEVDDNSLLLLDFGDATFAMTSGNNCAGGRMLQWGALGVYGTDGVIETLEIEPLSGHPTKLYLESHHAIPELEETVDGVYSPAGWLPYVDATHAALPEPHVYADIMHCVACIRDGTPPIASGEHAAHVIEIIEKGYLAARSGQTQTLTSSF